MKVLRIISEHKQKKSLGQVEAIVKLPDGKVVTRHIRKPAESAKPSASTEVLS